MKRMHDMPFGCLPLASGGVRFRLWAPGASEVGLRLEDSGTLLAMTRAQAGWWRLDCPQAAVGSRYRFQIDGSLPVPDPASRANPDDVHGASLVTDPLAFDWEDGHWRGRPWEEAVIYELHVGAFTPQGSFAGVEAKLDHLRELGATAIELMPIADFPGRRNWGYDGVLPFAPDSTYGTPEDLKRLVQSAHARGLMVFLDVVYNHFGPEGNYLHAYAPQFFTDRHHTPWGAAINFDGEDSRTVRDFFIHNALYWLEEFHIDGLRLDAVHAIADDSEPDILTELAATVRNRLGGSREVHLVLENDANDARYLGTRASAGGRYDAQWNDDLHHCWHVLLSGERDGYYADYAQAPLAMLGRCLAEGFAYQGEPSAYRGGRPRGTESRGLRPSAFVAFLQNHDQVGNRAFGERISRLAPPQRVRAALSVLLLAPQPPLLFMGEEWGAREPFPFFCDFEPELAGKVTEGRRGEFARFDRFRDATARLLIPDPGAAATFDAAHLDWNSQRNPEHAEWLALSRALLAVRAREIAPRLRGASTGTCSASADGLLAVHWELGDGSRLHVTANLQDAPRTRVELPVGRLLYATSENLGNALTGSALPAWAVVWTLAGPHAEGPRG
jgi:malto-oligosyltrehalose trehalohydrolase